MFQRNKSSPEYASVSRRDSIRNTLINITMKTVVVAVIMAGVVFTAKDLWSYGSNTVQSIRSLALVVADRSTGAISFDDPELATKNLFALRSKKIVSTACIYKEDGDLFAQFVRNDSRDPICGASVGNFKAGPGAEDTPIPEDDLIVREPIVLDNSPIGTIIIRSDELTLTTELAHSIPLLFAVVLASTVAAYFLSLKLSRRITDPIVSLADTTKSISQAHDYSLRAKVADDIHEVEMLVEHFNEMIELIEQQRHELMAAKTNLEETVTQRTRELDVARQHAESANQAKSIFLANMSHELRTPLTSIAGFTEFLESDQSLSSPQKEKLKLIRRSSDHLLDLINDVLELSKIEAGQVTLQLDEFRLGMLFEALRDTFWARARRNGITLELENQVDDKLQFQADGRKIRQVLSNLVENAMKFTKGGEVRVRASAAQQSDSSGRRTIVFEVRDTGVGIEADELDMIFEKFAQSAAGRTSGQGSGLGLAIVRQYVDLMDGQIDVSSEVDQGTCFRIELPLRLSMGGPRLDPTEAARHRILKPGQPEYRNLIVDDNPQNRILLSEILSAAGFPTNSASDGRHAIELFQEWRPDLIWMDMKMPVMDGLEATRVIRDSAEGKDVTIIAITANVLDEDRAKIFDAGCDDLMSKPFRLQEIYFALQKHLGVEFVDKM